MANYLARTIALERHELRLTTPTNLTELDKMVHAAARDYCAQHGLDADDMFDDVVNVTVEDDEIVAWWETQVPSKRL